MGGAQAAKAVQCSLEYTTLRKVTQATEIYYDPNVEARPAPLPGVALISIGMEMHAVWSAPCFMRGSLPCGMLP